MPRRRGTSQDLRAQMLFLAGTPRGAPPDSPPSSIVCGDERPAKPVRPQRGAGRPMRVPAGPTRLQPEDWPAAEVDPPAARGSLPVPAEPPLPLGELPKQPPLPALLPPVPLAVSAPPKPAPPLPLLPPPGSAPPVPEAPRMPPELPAPSPPPDPVARLPADPPCGGLPSLGLASRFPAAPLPPAPAVPPVSDFPPVPEAPLAETPPGSP